jgi:hypothetical protein
VSGLSCAVPFQPQQVLDEMLLAGTQTLAGPSLADWEGTISHTGRLLKSTGCLHVTYNTVSLHTEIITVGTVVLM